MKKLYILAALLMATTSAHAGGISFQINGERVRIESPRNCSGMSCIKITSPGYTGTLGNIDLRASAPRTRATMTSDDRTGGPPAPAPAQATAPPPPAPAATAVRPRPLRQPLQREPKRAPPAPPPAPIAAAPAAATGSGGRSRRVRPELADRRLGDGREQGQRAHRGMRRQSVRLFRQHRRKNPDQHEAPRQQVDRPDQ